LQAIGVFLAFRIKKVKVKGLNDSREVSAILYVTTIITVAVFLVTIIFGDYINIDGGTYMYGLGVSTATTVVLVLIFVPKVSLD
jgi:gamma-aminobutyric acid type B receptor